MNNPFAEAHFKLIEEIDTAETLDWESLNRADYSFSKELDSDIDVRLLSLKAEKAALKSKDYRDSSFIASKDGLAEPATMDMTNSFDSLLSDEEEPFYKYIQSDKTGYKKASETINPKTGRKYIDPFDYMLIDDSGAFLMNIDFKFTRTKLFRKAAITYKQTGKFTNFKRDSVPYTSFRKKEEYRRKNGMTQPCRLNPDGSVTDLHISGEFYNFLNYGRVKVVDIEILKTNPNAKPKKKLDFPSFIDFQFWYTTIKEFARQNGYNIITLKARRKGASYVESIDSSNILNLVPHSIVIHAAGEKKFLTQAGAITNMSYRQLVFYERHTPFIRGGLDAYGKSKGLLSNNLDSLQLGFKYKNGMLGGWLSTLFTVSTKNNPGAAVGKDAEEIKCDELNDFPNFSDFMGVTNPTVTTGSIKTGMISAFGTGGAKEGNWADFESNYFNTIKYDFLPMANVFDTDSTDETIGFFMPYWWGLQGQNLEGEWALDEDGNTNYRVAIGISKQQRKDKKLETGIGRDYILHCSQFANRPSEAFNSGTETILTSLELKEHIKNVKINKEYHYYSDGAIVRLEGEITFRSNEWLHDRNIVIHPFVDKVPFNSNEDFAGCFRVFHRPFKDDTGRTPNNLYFVTYDPVGSEIVKGEIQDRHSLASIQVWMYANNISHSSGKILVASWIGRRDTHKEMDEISMDICDYYNAKILPEMDRGNVKANYKAAGVTNKILPDPTEVILNRKVNTGKSLSLGMIIGKGNRKIEGIDYFKDFLYEKISVGIDGRIMRRFHFIHDLPFLLEIDKFRFNGNFDRISSAILAVYQMNLQTALKINPKGSKSKNKKRLSQLMLGK